MSFITGWAQGIIVAVIVATIIEMLLPSNGNGKYVKTIVGMFVLFSIISPVIGKLKNDNYSKTEAEQYFKDLNKNETVETSSLSINNEEYIKKMYEENLKIDIKSKISQKGYVVGDINLDISNNEEYTLNGIQLKIISRNDVVDEEGNTQNATTIVENIENVKVSLGGSSKDEKKEEVSVINESEKNKLKEYLSSVYEVNERNILVN